MHRYATLLMLLWSSTTFAQPCPEVVTAASSSYSATFSGAEAEVLLERWNVLEAAVARCEQLRGKPVSLKDEIGDSFFQRLRHPDVVLQARSQSKLELSAQAALGKGLTVNSLIFNQLTAEDQRALRTKYPMMVIVEHEAVGRVVSHQIMNTSKAGSDAGSRLGSAVGQASYIDRSFANRSYSATGQLGAGLVGAVIGASLNRSDQVSYLINYGVQTLDGSVKTVAYSSTSPAASPIGQCVLTTSMTEAPVVLCGDSLLAFLSRVKVFSASIENAQGRSPADRIRCKADGLGVLSLTPDECKALNGVPIE